MTVIVSTIRVGGIKVLKAFVGRARESKANAEKEILSSTSEDVCELWSGREVVRELGNPEGMKELVLLEESVQFDLGLTEPSLTEPTRVLDISAAVTAGVLSKPNALPEEEVPAISNGAPNIALNVRNSTVSSTELTVWAFIATLLQLSALVFPAITTYHLEWRKGGSAIARYGYPCFATGTIAVIVGMIFCGRVIEGSTTEHEFKLLSKGLGSGAQLMRLQKACTVSDQHFMSYAIFNSPDDLNIRTSRLNRTSSAATLTAVVGFVVQFVGLRALHWSATIYQLGIMLILTIVRSLVRRGLAVDPFFYPLLDGFEVAWLSLYLLKRDEERTRGPTYRHVLQTMSREQTMIQEDPTIRKHISISKKGASSRKVPSFKIQWWPLSITLTGDEIIQRRDPDPYEQMLEPIVRWEPFTGYYTINKVQDAIRECLNSERNPRLHREILEIEAARLSRVFYSLADIYSTIVENDTPIDSTILRDYCDLRRLVPTAGQTSDIANVLCLATERTMALVTKSQHVLWRRGQHPATSSNFSGCQISFNLAIIRGAYDTEVKSHRRNLEISVNGKIADSTALAGNSSEPLLIWTVDREMVCNILSLWLFSLELRRSTVIQTSTAFRKMASMDEYAPRGFDELIHRRNIYYRIVGSATVSASKSSNDQSPLEMSLRWLHDTLCRMSGFGGDQRRTLTRGGDGVDPIDTWVVWGSHLSSSTHPADPLDSKTQSASTKHSEPELEDFAILTRPETNIAEHCALELYSLFMESIASRIETKGGRTMKLHVLEEEWRDRWRNSLLGSIANECVTAGLARDVPEANTVIIPAFMKHNLLPSYLHKEIKWSRNKEGKAYGELEGKKYEAPISWHVLDPLDMIIED
ncbi:hypothetical protein FB567DRAFT_585784 [Paraphoma chrysanthemicola]|uniref:Uncharacterized protein n=1 Tax=Paraphoma chrysanthemicola TaxID=798071 RepID=A0A8K0RGH8_9PLEO|nr:hypothetical protein FB567DRAFT_585784 [Paraphoma chrysanthemicola]